MSFPEAKNRLGIVLNCHILTEGCSSVLGNKLNSTPLVYIKGSYRLLG